MSKIFNFYKNTAATAILSLLAVPAVQASSTVVSGTIYQTTSPAGTTIDFWRLDLSADSVLEIDVRASEGFINTLPGHPGAYSDLNGDGEITLMDTHLRIYKNSISAANEIALADDSSAYTDGLSNGWADGTVNSRDSYGLWEFTAGTYIVAFGDYNLQLADAIGGFNTGDTLGSNQNHSDYQLQFSADAPFTVTAVPVPAAVWLFGSAMTGFGLLRRKKIA